MLKRYLVNGCLVVTSAFVALIIAEIAYRSWTDMPLDRFENFVDAKLDLIAVNGEIIAHDPLIGWRLSDDFGTQGSGFLTGAYGIRMNQNVRSAPAKNGILAVGDSFTAGSGVTNAETWPAQLELMIDKPVLNASAGAWATDQIVLRAEALIPEIMPSVIIVSMLAQDNLRNSYDLYGGGYKPWFELKNDELQLKGVPVPRVSARPIPHRPLRAIFGHFWIVHSTFMRLVPYWWASSKLGYNQVMEDPKAIDVSCKLMERLADISNRTGVRVITMTQYGAMESQAEKPAWYGEQVHQCAKDAGLEAIDTHGPLYEIANTDPDRFKELWLNEGGQLGHMSAKGNQFIAELVMKTQFQQ